MLENLGGTQIVRDDGHFGDYNQPYDTFELVDRLIAAIQPDHNNPEPHMPAAAEASVARAQPDTTDHGSPRSMTTGRSA